MSTENADQFLASDEEKYRRYKVEQRREEYERALEYIANLQFPSDVREPNTTGEFKLTPEKKSELMKSFLSARAKPVRILSTKEKDELKSGESVWYEGSPSFMESLRSALEHIWPEIWSDEPDQPPAFVPVRAMQGYLRNCWDAHDNRERDWHIHRAREYYQRTRILRETRNLRDLSKKALGAGNAEMLHHLTNDIDRMSGDLLDKVPAHGCFLEDALFHLQEMATKPSRRPLHCPTPLCTKPYFFSHKKGTRYCKTCRQRAQAHDRKKQSGRDTWHRNKATYRKKGGSK